jgi:hypothetical protein
MANDKTTNSYQKQGLLRVKLWDETNDLTFNADGSLNTKTILVDPTSGTQTRVEANGGLAVNVQDQASRAVDLFFAQDVGSPTTMIMDTTADSYVVYLATGHGLVATDMFVMFDPSVQHGHTAHVVSVVGDNQVNMDRPVSYELTAANTIVQQRSMELDVDGSSTRQVFSVGSSLTGILHITRVIFQIVCTNPALYNLFGDQTALSRGVLLRQTRNDNGTTNHWNVKTNAELANLMYDVSVQEEAKVFDVNGLTGRLTYGGQTKHGVVLALSGGEALEIIIQDNLSGLISFRIIAQGHLVTED